MLSYYYSFRTKLTPLQRRVKWGKTRSEEAERNYKETRNEGTWEKIRRQVFSIFLPSSVPGFLMKHWFLFFQSQNFKFHLSREYRADTSSRILSVGMFVNICSAFQILRNADFTSAAGNFRFVRKSVCE